EMEREIHLNELPLNSRDLNRLLKGNIEAFKSNAVFHADGEHYLTVKLAEEPDLLRIEMQYHGLLAAERLVAELDKVKLDSIQTVRRDLKLLHEKNAALYLEIPFHT
ncbi:MAG: hypothetical protein K0S39_6295, partial [Paenibacillus sp.]|nr:hypothetical protein [Paenibacillus sp.]